MSYREVFNKIIEEVNSVIKFVFNNKIFLLCSLIAMVVVLFGLLFNLGKGEWNDVLLTISISMILAMNYSYAHKCGNVEKKSIVGAELIFFTIIAIVVGLNVFYDKTVQNPMYVYHKIKGNLSVIYLMCLIVPVVVTIVVKIIRKSGQPLYGGIISGHAAFATALFFINFHNKPYWPLVILPIVYILLPRCIKLGRWYKTSLCPFSISSVVLLILFTIIGRHNWVLIWANVFILILMLICQGGKVHRVKEIFFGIILGIICSLVILGIFA